LPFLAVNGNFDYWKHPKTGDQRQKHLLAILRALDAVRTSAYNATDASDAYAYAAADAARAADTARTAYAARAADTAAYAAAYAADANTDTYAADAARAANAATYAANYYAIDIKSMLLDDITTIKSRKRNLLATLKNIKNEKRKFKNDTDIYGELWNNFQGALREAGCEYWGKWYEQVFAKGFMLDDADREEIDLRLSVPGEIQARGAAEVARYVLELKEKGTERLNEARVIILGNKGSGKTSLARRLKNPKAPMPKIDESTEGVDVIDWVIPVDAKQSNSTLNVHVWDFAGHVITHSAHRCFMSERCLYILLINGRTEGDNRIEYWLEQIRNYGKNSPVLILVNNYDEHPVDIAENTLKKEFPTIEGFHQVNIDAGGEPLETFRQTVMNHLRNNSLWKDQQISAPAYKVKEALRQKFAQGNNFIKQNEFDEIAKNNDVKPEEHKQLLRDLRDLGICLWYGENDVHTRDTMVLNPSWISHGIYRLINWGLINKKRELSISDFCVVFTKNDKSKYPAEKAPFLFKLMKIYQLAFSKSSTDDNVVFVPLLLPADRPKETDLPVFKFGERLRMEYCANQALPPYTVARLAVLHSEELIKERSWRFGAVLCWGDTEALVEEKERARSVTVYVKGPKRTEYISKLRTTLERIFDDYKNSLQSELKYEVLIPKDLQSQVDILSDYDKLLQPVDQIIGNATAKQKLFIPRLPLIDPNPTVYAYYDYRTINVGPNGIYQEGRGNSVCQSSRLPENLTDKEWSEFREFISQFLESKEAEELPMNKYKKLQEEVTVAKQAKDRGAGWQRFRSFLEDTANAATIVSAITAFTASHGNQIAQWIQSIF